MADKKDQTEQPKEQAKKTRYFFPPDTSIEAETLEEAVKLYQDQQKGNASA